MERKFREEEGIKKVKPSEEPRKITARPSRLWWPLLKYYIASFIIAVPIIFELYTGFLMSIVRSILEKLLQILQSYGLPLSISLPKIPKIYFSFLLIFPIILFAIAELKRFRIKYHFRRNGVSREIGILSPDSFDVGMVAYIQLRRSLFEKLLNIGTIHIKTPGEEMENIRMEGIRNPKKWREEAKSRVQIKG